jgi:hypothetical protein
VRCSGGLIWCLRQRRLAETAELRRSSIPPSTNHNRPNGSNPIPVPGQPTRENTPKAIRAVHPPITMINARRELVGNCDSIRFFPLRIIVERVRYTGREMPKSGESVQTHQTEMRCMAVHGCSPCFKKHDH